MENLQQCGCTPIITIGEIIVLLVSSFFKSNLNNKYIIIQIVIISICNL